jgi:hypothetical protein
MRPRALLPAEQVMARLDDESERSWPLRERGSHHGAKDAVGSSRGALATLDLWVIRSAGRERGDGLVMAVAWVANSAATSAATS